MDRVYYMSKAYEQALSAFEKKETPIGCVVVLGGEIIGRGHNLRNTKKNALWHAELIAINEACGFVGDWRLEGASLFVTVEPCPMCAGAIIQARIKEVAFGAVNGKAGCAGSVTDLFALRGFNHRVSVTGGVMKDECAELMSFFFAGLRDQSGNPLNGDMREAGIS